MRRKRIRKSSTLRGLKTPTAAAVFRRRLKSKTHKLRESEKRFRSVIQNAPLGVAIVDSAGNLTECNAAMTKIIGYAREELLQKNFADFTHPDDLAREWELIRDMWDRKTNTYRMEKRYIHKDGRVIWVDVAAAVIIEKDVMTFGFAFVEDITEQRRLQQKLRDAVADLELAQRISGVGNWSLDPAVGVPVWSDQVYEIYERDPALGPPPVEYYKNIYHADQYEIFRNAVQAAISEGKPYDIQLKLELPDNRIKWIRAMCRPDDAPGPAGRFLRGTIQDITVSKIANEKLQEYSQRLEEMVEERTRELKKAQAELLLNERMAVLGNIAGSLSHEIRNPLAAIDASAYFLNMKFGNDDEKMRQHLGRIGRNVQKATAIIESLLNLTSMEKPSVREYDLKTLIFETCRVADIPPAVHVSYRFPDAPACVHVDGNQIRMALKNIIKNAVQAMAEKGTITITVRQAWGAGFPACHGRRTGMSAPHSETARQTGMSASQADTVEISIADDGPGIPPDHLGKVFDPLFTTKTHGIGFGLSIAGMIVENHGGTIRATSGPEGGACIVMTLPVNPR